MIVEGFSAVAADSPAEVVLAVSVVAGEAAAAVAADSKVIVEEIIK